MPEELDPLEQRMKRVLGLRQDALVELEPADLAIDVQRRIRQVRRVDSPPVGGRELGRQPLRPATPRTQLSACGLLIGGRRRGHVFVRAVFQLQLAHGRGGRIGRRIIADRYDESPRVASATA